ncbi:MAG: pilus assembly protein CpaC [Moraxellaceae bacterium]|nr:pilus assembly protein CpaC [Moraxellaceae bacterium]
MKTRGLLMLALLGALTGAPHAAAQTTEPVTLDFAAPRQQDVVLQVGQSRLVTSPVPLQQAVIGSPEIADIKLLSPQRILVLGIKPGTTNLMLRPSNSDQTAVLSVSVSFDRNGIKRKIAEAMPTEERIEVRDSNDKVILSGQASSAASLEMALAIARSFVPESSVVNLVQVAGSQQVMLEARVAEISRNSLKDLGISTAILDNNGKWSFASGLPVTGAFGAVGYIDNDGSPFDNLAVTLEALEKKGLAKTLAEPNLVALSGQEANFLAGGEIPIPVAQNAGLANTITVEYKEFGVGLRFTPTVLNRDRINLKLVSEVSAIDPTNSFEIGGGITIPAISTRRAGTSVELGDGQSFAIAGLMQSNMKNAISQFPFLGNIPVLGALFRSTDFQREESELVIMVTARLVKPVHRNQLAAPTDVFSPPSDLDQYLLGRIEGKNKQRQLAQAPAGTSSSSGGVDGSFGHQLNAAPDRNATSVTPAPSAPATTVPASEAAPAPQEAQDAQ